MVRQRALRFLLVGAVLLLAGVPITSFIGHLFGANLLSSVGVHPVWGGPVAVTLGFDCGLGAVEVGPDSTGEGVPDADGDLDSQCTWIGDVDSDGVLDPLVSDDPSTFPLGTGGGMTLEVRALSLPAGTNGFDITIGYDTRYLMAASFDQAGLAFDGSFAVVPATIDNSIGRASLQQLLLAQTVSGDQTFFRLRFDVVGVKTSPVSIINSIITNPTNPANPSVPHNPQNADVNSEMYFDSGETLGWNIFWMFSPNPALPNSDLTLTATASCTSCTGALSYSWDTDSDLSPDATGSPAVITPPSPVSHRVILSVADEGGNVATAVRRLPLSAILTGPSTLSLGSTGSYSGTWIGGIPTYSLAYRFCPGSSSSVTQVCSNPLGAGTLNGLTSQTNNQNVIYKYAGVYTNTLKVTEATPSQISAVDLFAMATQVTTVTGTPAAYTVTVSNIGKAIAGGVVTIDATVKYFAGETVFYDTDSDTLYDTGEPMLAGPTPADLTPSQDDARIKFRDSNADLVRSGTELVFYDIDGNNAFSTTIDLTITGSTGTIVQDDPKIRFLDDVNVNSILDYAYPNSFRSSTFDVLFAFGDGPTAVVSGGIAGCATTSAGCAISTTHAYSTKGSYTITATAKETAAGALSRIQETGQSSILVNPNALITSIGVAPTDHPNSNDVLTFTATTSGGTSPYQVSWDFGDGGSGTGSVASHAYTFGGVYIVTVTVQDANGESTSATRAITVTGPPPPLTGDFTFAPSSPLAGEAVTFTASASGGTPSYSFSWNFGDGSSDTGIEVSHAFATEGSYSVTLTISDSASVSVTVTHKVTVTAEELIVTVVCPDTGLTAGKPFMCDVSASGGTPPYTGTGQREAVVVAKGVQEVTFTVTDSHGVIAAGTTAVNVAAQPLTLDFSYSPLSPVAGQPVTFTAHAQAGTLPYIFSWSFGDGGTSTENPAVHTFDSGDYTVTVTVTDLNSVTVTSTQTVSVAPATPGFDFIVSLDPTSGKVTQGGSTSSTVTVRIVSGTSETVSLQVLCPACAANGITATLDSNSGTPTFSALLTVDTSLSTSPDSYAIIVEGTSGILVHSASITLTVNEVATLSADFTFTPAQPTSGKPVSFSTTATGGTAPFTFEWDFGDGTTGSGSDPSHAYSAKGSFTVSVTVTDDAFQTATQTKTVVVGGQPLVVNASCDNGTAGKPVNCSATVSGGTLAYSVTWDFGDGETGTGTSLSHVYAVKGAYTVSVTVTDANNESASTSFPVNVSPQPLTISASCSNGTAGKPVDCTTSATGGTSPYSFSWDLEKDGSVDGQGPSFSPVFPAKGTYSVDVKVVDLNQDFASTNLIVVIDPQPLLVDFTFSPAATVGKPLSFTATASGGTTPYVFAWDFGDGSPTETGPTASHMYALEGSYSVSLVVTDANQDTAQSGASVDVSQTPELSVDFTFTPSTTGKPVSFQATASGGAQPYSFSWDFGDSSSGTGESTGHSYAVKGTYSVTVTVTEDNGSQASQTHDVTVTPQPLDLSISAPSAMSGKPVSYAATVTGGNGPYQVVWSFGEGGDAAGTSVEHTFSVKGTYTISATVTDANGQTLTGSVITIVAGQSITGDFTADPSTSNDGETVTFTATVSGGTAPYLFTWDFGDLSSGTGNPVSHVFALPGTFTVSLVITDSNGDFVGSSHDFEVISLSPLFGDFSYSALTSGKPVSFTATATGGVPPYSFEWVFGDGEAGTGESVSHSYAVKGTYTVYLTIDDDSSVPSISVVKTLVVDAQPLSVSISFSPATPTSGKPVQFFVVVSGGTAPYSFILEFGDGYFGTTSLESHTYAVKGTYPVVTTVFDSNGDPSTVTTTITVDPQPLVLQTSCSGGTAGKPVSCDINDIRGGTSPYSFTWDMGGDGSIDGAGTTFQATFPAKGTYTIVAEATDANGDTTSQTITVTVNPQPFVGDFGLPPQATVGQSVVVNATASGGTGPYTFTWDFGNGAVGVGSQATHVYSTKGSYTVTMTVMDANGATATVQHSIIVLPQTLLADVTVSPSPATVGMPVSFTATASGGTSPYIFLWSFGDNLTGQGNPISHTYAFPINVTVLLTVFDANNATATAGHVLAVRPVPVSPILLTFDAYDADKFDNGIGELDVLVNGVRRVNIPAGLNNLTGTGVYPPYRNVWVSFGPFDITSLTHQGLNTLLFRNPLGTHESQIRNIIVYQNGTIFLLSTPIKSISPGTSRTYTFSNPPLVLTSFQLSHIAFSTEPVTLTATFTGGTGPFKCTFTFGDGNSRSVTATGQSCSTSYTYFSSRLRTAIVRVRGVTTGDDVRGSLTFMVEPQPGYTGIGLAWLGTVTLGQQQVFTVDLTNPASMTVLVRLDLTIARPDGSKQLFVSPTFVLNSLQTLTGLTFNYTPTAGTGSYCFKTPVMYGVDTNGNSILEDLEILGKRTARSGCFQVVDPVLASVAPFLFIGTAMIPKGRSKLAKYFAKRKEKSQVVIIS